MLAAAMQRGSWRRGVRFMKRKHVDLLLLILMVGSLLVGISGVACAEKSCSDPRCQWFNQKVQDNHEHSYKCSDPRCQWFEQWTQSGHQHTYKCSNPRCQSFEQWVPAGHQHSNK